MCSCPNDGRRPRTHAPRRAIRVRPRRSPSWRLAWMAVQLVAVLSSGRVAVAQSGDASLISGAERAWLEQHEPVRVAFDGYFPPYSFLNDAGELEGFAVDMFALLSERLDLEIEVAEQNTWQELFDAAVARDVDVVATMVHRPERTEWFTFTRPYIFKSLVIATREGDDRIRQRENLAGKTVALVRSYQYVDRILEEFPTVTPQYHETMVDALNAVSTGQADATVTFLGGGHFLRTRHLMTNLRFVAVYDADTSNERVAVRSDWPVLAEVIDRGLTAITESERLELERRWLPAHVDDVSETEPDRIVLTDREQEWIAEHPVIRVGVDPEFHPFEFIDDNGTYEGIGADYLALLGPRLGLNFEVAPDLTWSEVIERARAREIDMLPCVGRTQEREQYLVFTEPYVEYQRVIITRTDMPFLRGLADLQELRVAVQTNSSHEGFLRENSTIEPIGYPTLEECVRAVSSGEVDALVGNIASLSHWIRRLNLTNLKVAGAASDEVHTLQVGVRSDWPELLGILQKGFASLTADERREIAERWVVLSYEPEVDRRSMWRVVLVSTLTFLFLAGWIVFIRRQEARLRIARDQAVEAGEKARIANEELDELRRGLQDLVAKRTAELVEAERRFQEAQKMEALGTLVGGIAHDFNNVLQGVLGAICLVEEELTDEDHKRYLREASSLGYRGADMIRQLLAVARKGGGRKSHVDLHVLLDELAPILRTTLPSTIEFERHQEEGPFGVFGHASLLQQVVLNLVNNARDAVLGCEHPRVTLTLRAVEDAEPLPDALGDGRFAVIEVADNGPGIPPEALERIFDPFFTTKPKGKGTGLGLAMAFGAIQDHGGAIDVATGPAGGTTFRVYLPLSEERSVSVTADHRQLRRGDGETILLADDEEVVRENHAALLRRLGYQVLTASNGEEALNVLRNWADDVRLVILDVLMPVLDGTSASRVIHEEWPGLPVLFLSAYDPEGDLPDRLRPSGDIALMKPCTPQELSRVIREILDGDAGG